MSIWSNAPLAMLAVPDRGRCHGDTVPCQFSRLTFGVTIHTSIEMVGTWLTHNHWVVCGPQMFARSSWDTGHLLTGIGCLVFKPIAVCCMFPDSWMAKCAC